MMSAASPSGSGSGCPSTSNLNTDSMGVACFTRASNANRPYLQSKGSHFLLLQRQMQIETAPPGCACVRQGKGGKRGSDGVPALVDGAGLEEVRVRVAHFVEVERDLRVHSERAVVVHHVDFLLAACTNSDIHLPYQMV